MPRPDDKPFWAGSGPTVLLSVTDKHHVRRSDPFPFLPQTFRKPVRVKLSTTTILWTILRSVLSILAPTETLSQGGAFVKLLDKAAMSISGNRPFISQSSRRLSPEPPCQAWPRRAPGWSIIARMIRSSRLDYWTGRLIPGPISGSSHEACSAKARRGLIRSNGPLNMAV
jgi:hypothetical protein